MRAAAAWPPTFPKTRFLIASLMMRLHCDNRMIIASPIVRKSQWRAEPPSHSLAPMDGSAIIQALLDVTGWSQAELARQMTRLGVHMQPDKINKTLTGKRQIQTPEVDVIRSLYERAQTGETEAPNVLVPEYDVRASAGGGFVIDEETIKDRWPFSRSYLQELRIRARDAVVIEVGGDSMEPTLRSSDRIMIDRSDVNPARPGVFVLWDSNATVVKRVEAIPASDPPMVRLISDNPHHGKYDVLAEHVNIVGRVIWYARRL